MNVLSNVLRNEELRLSDIIVEMNVIKQSDDWIEIKDRTEEIQAAIVVACKNDLLDEVIDSAGTIDLEIALHNVVTAYYDMNERSSAYSAHNVFESAGLSMMQEECKDVIRTCEAMLSSYQA